MDYPYIGNVIIPTDELIFFRGVGIPPTRITEHEENQWNEVPSFFGACWHFLDVRHVSIGYHAIAHLGHHEWFLQNGYCIGHLTIMMVLNGEY